MLNRKTRQVILEVPKSGSRSLVAAATARYGKKVFAHHGHFTLAELSQLLPLNEGEPYHAVGVIRNPRDRLVSQVNAYCKNKNVGLSTALKACVEQSNIIFKPQVEFVRHSPKRFKLDLFPMERHKDAQASVGGGDWLKGEHVKNVGEYKYQIVDIAKHPLYDQVATLLEPDWELYHCVN